MGILNGHNGVLDGPEDLAVEDFHQEVLAVAEEVLAVAEAVLAVAEAASAEGVHPAGGKSGSRKK